MLREVRKTSINCFHVVDCTLFHRVDGASTIYTTFLESSKLVTNSTLSSTGIKGISSVVDNLRLNHTNVCKLRLNFIGFEIKFCGFHSKPGISINNDRLSGLACKIRWVNISRCGTSHLTDILKIVHQVKFDLKYYNQRWTIKICLKIYIKSISSINQYEKYKNEVSLINLSSLYDSCRHT